MRERDKKARQPDGSPRAQHPKRGLERRAAERGAFGGSTRSPNDPIILYGWHTVAAALANPRRRIRRMRGLPGYGERVEWCQPRRGSRGVGDRGRRDRT